METAMRSRLGTLTAVTLLAAAAGAAAPAHAGGGHDRVHADSFGNLIVESRGGYKRIVVGAGHLAGQLNTYQQTGDEAAIAEEDDSATVVVESRPCYRPPVLVKGRSYMYGFDQGEIPLRGGDCR
jgi:hypothetical protein